MTPENRVLIKPEDIVSVQFQCATCNAAVTIPTEKLASAIVAITQGCSYCQTPSGFAGGTSETVKLADFNILLGELASLLKGRNIIYSFQVKSVEQES